MTRLTTRFAALRGRGEKALICYVVAGDPNIDRTVSIIRALDRAGVDAVELGIPFSDPLADGPSIQASSQRSLDNGTRIDDMFEVVRQVRASSGIPIVLMTYFNPTMQYGVERFANACKSSGVDGTIQTDLTPEESEEWVGHSRRCGLDTIFLLAPTSTINRIEVVSKLSTGFVYCVSRTGVTGARADVPTDLPGLVGRVREKTEMPVCVGFGISTPEHVASIGAFADGVVVGSALVNIIAAAGTSESLEADVEQYAASLKQATRRTQ